MINVQRNAISILQLEIITVGIVERNELHVPKPDAKKNNFAVPDESRWFLDRTDRLFLKYAIYYKINKYILATRIIYLLASSILYRHTIMEDRFFTELKARIFFRAFNYSISQISRTELY